MQQKYVDSPEELFSWFKAGAESQFNQRFLWRGQRSAFWALSSSLNRQAPNSISGGDLREVENWLVDQFMRKANAYYDRPPSAADVTSWLVLMQHYGAPTRLLDWTTSPYIALYFAVKDPPLPNDEIADDEGSEFAVWRLETEKCVNPDSIGGAEPWAGHNFEAGLREAIEAETETPWLIHPRIPDQRMLAQSGALTACTNRDATIDPHSDGFGEAIVKIQIPARMRTELLHTLHSMGIQSSVLFPGLDGLGESLRRQLEFQSKHML